jgi:hypothetical protein
VLIQHEIYHARGHFFQDASEKCSTPVHSHRVSAEPVNLQLWQLCRNANDGWSKRSCGYEAMYIRTSEVNMEIGQVELVCGAEMTIREVELSVRLPWQRLQEASPCGNSQVRAKQLGQHSKGKHDMSR